MDLRAFFKCMVHAQFQAAGVCLCLDMKEKNEPTNY